jgi:putative hydrolase of HD superfamily
MDRLDMQIGFILEIDKLKKILRRNHLADGSRVENDAEHSWYFAMIAIVLYEYANETIDLLRVVKMALIHDIVEIDSGDTFIYDDKGKLDQKRREEEALDRIFSILPPDQCSELSELWREFESQESMEAKFAKAIDRIAAILLNYASNGKTWKQFHVKKEKIMEINCKIELGSMKLWDYIKNLIEDAGVKGFIEKS